LKGEAAVDLLNDDLWKGHESFTQCAFMIRYFFKSGDDTLTQKNDLGFRRPLLTVQTATRDCGHGHWSLLRDGFSAGLRVRSTTHQRHAAALAFIQIIAHATGRLASENYMLVERGRFDDGITRESSAKSFRSFFIRRAQKASPECCCYCGTTCSL
jgi:hypothetical protein